MHEGHGIVAATDFCAGQIALATINETELRAQHRRAHELGLEHR